MNDLEHAGVKMTDTEAVSAALFTQLVMQQANMALMMMGKSAHPATGETMKDLDGASFFIDQLEMLENKTRGNLTNVEQGYLKETLMSLRLAYVEAVESPTPAPSAGAKPGINETPPAPAEASKHSAGTAPSHAADEGATSGLEEHRKKFTKKY
jgi:hypothetical protein